MGGRGSGNYFRTKKSKLTTDYLQLDMRIIGKTPWLYPNHYLTYSWSRNENWKAEIMFAASGENIRLRYIFTTKNGEPIEINEQIPTPSKACNFGGERRYFKCLGCYKSVLLLYGGKHFRCRHCHGLVHPSVNESKLDRSIRSLRRFQRKLAPNEVLRPYDGVRDIQKPKWMRYSTYGKLMKKGIEKEDKMTQLFLQNLVVQ